MGPRVIVCKGFEKEESVILVWRMLMFFFFFSGLFVCLFKDKGGGLKSKSFVWTKNIVKKKVQNCHLLLQRPHHFLKSAVTIIGIGIGWGSFLCGWLFCFLVFGCLRFTSCIQRGFILEKGKS